MLCPVVFSLKRVIIGRCSRYVHVARVHAAASISANVFRRVCLWLSLSSLRMMLIRFSPLEERWLISTALLVKLLKVILRVVAFPLLALRHFWLNSGEISRQPRQLGGAGYYSLGLENSHKQDTFLLHTALFMLSLFVAILSEFVLFGKWKPRPLNFQCVPYEGWAVYTMNTHCCLIWAYVSWDWRSVIWHAVAAVFSWSKRCLTVKWFNFLAISDGSYLFWYLLSPSLVIKCTFLMIISKRHYIYNPGPTIVVKSCFSSVYKTLD